MAEIITLAPMASKPSQMPITELQEEFLRANYDRLTYEDLKDNTGIYVFRIYKLLKKWGLKKSNNANRTTKKQRPAQVLFNVNDYQCWI